MENKIEIFKTNNSETEIRVQFDENTVWLNQIQMASLFDKDVRTVNEHIQNIYSSEELYKDSTIRKFRIVRNEGNRIVQRNIDHYNLDVIISVGYRVNSKRGILFRQWATQRLKDYLVKGYAINEQRLTQTQQEIIYLKSGVRILSRAIEDAIDDDNRQLFEMFAKGLSLLDDYDHQTLDAKGLTNQEVNFPEFDEYMKLICEMNSEFSSDVFAKPKDESFHSSINQIKQAFDGKDLYPSLEEKAANLLYFITKNHSFVDGNKRIAATCFIYFLEKNNALIKKDGNPIIDNNTLAALTLFIATSKQEESEIVKQLIVSILNRNK